VVRPAERLRERVIEALGPEPPPRLAGHGIAGPVRFQEEYTLTADGAQTILTESISATPRGLFRLAQVLMRRRLLNLIAADLARSKELVEAETH
jgi:hypothetical protein